MTNKENERRVAERRGSSPNSETRRASREGGERRVVEQRGVASAMVDALEDILKWERASERSLRVAAAAEPSSSEQATS